MMKLLHEKEIKICLPYCKTIHFHTLFLLSLTTSIVIVGAVFHALLSHLITFPAGWATIANHGVHTVVPLLTLFYWIRYETRTTPSLLSFDSRTALAVIEWPLFYNIYIQLRAHYIDDFYPYPFLNQPQLGWNRYLINVIGLMIVFVALAMVLVMVNRMVKVQTSTTTVVTEQQQQQQQQQQPPPPSTIKRDYKKSC